MSLLVAALLALSAPGTAAEPFALGAGAALFPLKPGLVLQSQTLELSPIEDAPCYAVVGGTWTTVETGVLAVSTSPAACRPDPAQPIIRPLWRAADTYVFSSTRDLEAAFALPLRTWKLEDGSPLVAPGLARLWASLDGKPLPASDFAWQALPEGLRLPPGFERQGELLAWTWKGRLSAGAHRLKLGYETELEYYDLETEGQTYPPLERPWFLARPGARGSSEEPYAALGPVRRLLYAWAPLKLWGGAPERVHLTLSLPKSLPENLALTQGETPYCMGRRELQFERAGAFPSDEFSLSYPRDPGRAPLMSRLEDWQAWRAPEPKPELTCDLTRRLRLDADELLQAKLAVERCLVVCPPSTLAKPKQK